MSDQGKRDKNIAIQEAFRELASEGYLAVGLVDPVTGAPIIDFGGGSSAGGDTLYETTANEFTASITDSSNNVVLSVDSLRGQSITEAMISGGSLSVQKVSDGKWYTITLDDFTWTAATKTIDTSDCSGAFVFATGDVVNISIKGPDKTLVQVQSAKQDIRVNPEWDRFATESREDSTNLSASTHDYLVSLDTFRDLVLSGKLIDADGTLTLKVYFTNDEDTATADWIQGYGYDDKNKTYVNSFTITNGTLTYGISFNNALYKHAKIELVASGATNTVIIKQKLIY